MKILNLFGKSVVSIAVLAAFCDANAAQNGRASMMQNTNTARMPTMPVFSLNTIGNPAVTTMDKPAEANVAHEIVPTIIPDPDPKPIGECPDGGVKNSEYTITMCMNDVLQCVNTGALQGGLRDLYNEDVRNSIMGGMKLCQTSVDKCIAEVRVNCRNVYAQSNDVWLDFNSRIIQPEYYNFVLRKTGLTPNQAENTCLLLDRNTYGSSFSAVSDTNAVNTEYNNKVGAYNKSVNGTLSKDNPQGVAVNTTGYDGNRGHYARWDAANGECLIRVAAYNKDKLITNSWLFGAVGNDAPAEVWEKAGSTFTCSKELFDFDSLMNDTKTAAVVGVAGGAVVGGAIGAGVGAGVYNKKKTALDEAKEEAAENMYKDPCEDEMYRRKLGDYIQHTVHKDQVLGSYLYENVKLKEEEKDGETVTLTEIDTESASPVFSAGEDWSKMSPQKCRAIHGLYSKLELYKSALSYCDTHGIKVNNVTVNVDEIVSRKSLTYVSNGHRVVCDEQTVCPVQKEVQEYVQTCLFLPLQAGLAVKEGNILCNHDGKCISHEYMKRDVATLESLLGEFSSVVDKRIIAQSDAKAKELNKGAEIGKGLAIGAATGAGVGGIITGITALVEKNNITCKVGDGLNSVALGKAHNIDSLKDFYVKWNLNLPDTVTPTSVVVDRASWEQACAQFNSKLEDCPRVQINFKDVNGKYTLIPSACKVSGSVCVISDSVAASHGI